MQANPIGLNLDLIYKKDMFAISTNKFFTDIELSDFPRLVEEGKI